MEKIEKRSAGNAFSAALLLILIVLIAIRLIEIFIYPDSIIIPSYVLFSVAMLGIFFLWLYAIKEKHRLIWLQKKKEELDEMKSKFTLITSHELMTPITVIKGYLKLLENKTLGGLTEKQERALDIINKYFGRLEGIKDNLTKLSTGTRKSLIGNLQPVSIEVLIRLTAREITPFIDKRGQRLQVDVEEDTPFVRMDINGIQEVLLNLLLNAIRFTPDGGKITVRAKGLKDRIQIEVEDSGIGIPKDRLKSIFESFYELRDIKKHSSGSIEFKSSGLGLGLAIAKDIVAAHKGQIWVESELGKFSRFTFTLPKDGGKQ
ncbi:MAG: HAMP domain-containing sensor histidine kinase [Candidatus Omnitrophota bacterium]